MYFYFLNYQFCEFVCLFTATEIESTHMLSTYYNPGYFFTNVSWFQKEKRLTGILLFLFSTKHRKTLTPYSVAS